MHFLSFQTLWQTGLKFAQLIKIKKLKERMRNMKKRIAFICACIITLMAAGGSEMSVEASQGATFPSKTEVKEMVYTTQSVDLRRGPGEEFYYYETVVPNSPLRRTGILDNGWSEVILYETVFYAKTEFLQTTPIETGIQYDSDGMETKIMYGQVYYQNYTSPNGVKIYTDAKDARWNDYLTNAIDTAGITNEMTEYEKCVAINQYLCDYVSGTEESHGPLEYSEASDYCIVLGSGTCWGYADAFQTMCCAVGIECNIRTGGSIDKVGNGGYHAWNHVYADGVWYWVDVSWNDVYNNEYLMSENALEGHF